MHQEFLFGGGDPCLCDIEATTGKKLSTWHLEHGIAKHLFCDSPHNFITIKNFAAYIIIYIRSESDIGPATEEKRDIQVHGFS